MKHRLTIAIFGCLVAFGPARAQDVALPFGTTGQYAAYCGQAPYKSQCYAGYEAALVDVIMNNRVANLCAPSQAGGDSDETKYQAAEALEIPKYVQWLKTHPGHMQEEFRKGLGAAIVAVYGCQ